MTAIKLGLWASVVCAFVYSGCSVDVDEEEGDDVVSAADQLKTDQQVADACAENPKKEAVCHIPPGNPANAHTICINKKAVQKHLDLHGDYLGVCNPGTGGTGGSGTTGGTGGSGTTGGTGGGETTSTSSGGSETTSSGSGAGGPEECNGGIPCLDDNDCGEEFCADGCCEPYVY